MRGRCSTPTADDRVLPVETMLDQAVNRFADLWEAEAGLKTFGQAVADAMAFHIEQGQNFDITVEEWLEWSRERLVAGGPRAGPRSMGVNVDLGPRARADARGLLPDPGRHRLRHRQVAGRGALLRHHLDGDQDRQPRRRQDLRRRDPRPVSRTRCWPTTCRRRSTGTPPA